MVPKCFEKSIGEGCKNHCVGTSLGLNMKFALGLPKGFCRSYQKSKDFVFIFESLEQKNEHFGGYDKFNVAVWKYLDKNGNTLVRCFQPRLNNGIVHVFKGNVIDLIEANYTPTTEELEAMD